MHSLLLSRRDLEFMLYEWLDVAALSLPARFTVADVQRAMQGHVLAEASVYGTYTLNPSLA